MITEKFSTAFDSYLKNVHEVSPDYTFTWRDGVKNVKVIMSPVLGSGRSVHSFINKETGDIFKPASWGTPAKGARGNIFDEDGGRKALTTHGVVYLR